MLRKSYDDYGNSFLQYRVPFVDVGLGHHLTWASTVLVIWKTQLQTRLLVFFSNKKSNQTLAKKKRYCFDRNLSKYIFKARGMGSRMSTTDSGFQLKELSSRGLSNSSIGVSAQSLWSFSKKFPSSSPSFNIQRTDPMVYSAEMPFAGLHPSECRKFPSARMSKVLAQVCFASFLLVAL